MPDPSEPKDDRTRPRFQLSLKALIFIQFLAACVVGLWVYNQTIGILTALALVGCLGVVYFEETLNDIGQLNKNGQNIVLLVSLLFVLGDITYLAFLRGPSRLAPRTGPKPASSLNTANLQLNTIGLVVQNFRIEYSRYPDDSDSHRFYRELMKFDSGTTGRRLLGKFVTSKDVEDESFSNPTGWPYVYRVLHSGSFVLIDPGEDGQLGGSIDPESGFVPDGSKASRDNLIYDSRNLDFTDP